MFKRSGGPRIDPCGTPKLILAGKVDLSLNDTHRENKHFLKIFILYNFYVDIVKMESAKLRAMSAIRVLRAFVLCVSCVPPKFACLASLRALRAYVSACLRALRAYVPPKFACLACLRALRVCVLTCFACLRASKICVLTCFALIVISKFTCQYNTAESNSHSA